MLGKPSEQLLEAISGQDWSDDIRAQARRFVRKVGDNKADEILDQAQGRTELSEIQWEVCIECWLSRAETRDDDWTFVTLVAEWIKDTQAVGIQRALRLANRVAWETAGDPHEPTKEAFSGFRHETPEAVFQVALYADRARFLFQLNRLDHVLDALPNEAKTWPLVEAYRGMEVLGSSTVKPVLGRNLIQKAWGAVRDVDDGRRNAVLDVCMQAFDIALNPEQFAEDVVAIGGDVPHDDRTALVLYRLARANGRLASTARASNPLMAKKYREIAIDQVRDALTRLNGDSAFNRFFGEQIRQERDALLINQGLDEHFYLLAQAQQELDRTEALIRQESRSNAIRSTEILALFSSAVAFAVGAAAIGSNATSAWASIAIGVMLGAGLLGFSLLLLLASRFTTRETLQSEDPVHDGTGSWTWRTLVVIAVVLAVAALATSLLIAPRIDF